MYYTSFIVTAKVDRPAGHSYWTTACAEMLLFTSTVQALTEHRAEKEETVANNVNEGKINQEIESPGPGEPEPSSHKWITNKGTQTACSVLLHAYKRHKNNAHTQTLQTQSIAKRFNQLSEEDIIAFRIKPMESIAVLHLKWQSASTVLPVQSKAPG